MFTEGTPDNVMGRIRHFYSKPRDFSLIMTEHSVKIKLRDIAQNS